MILLVFGENFNMFYWTDLLEQLFDLFVCCFHTETFDISVKYVLLTPIKSVWFIIFKDKRVDIEHLSSQYYEEAEKDQLVKL